MGLEARCTARFGRKSSTGKAHLEEKQLLFRGNFRLAIPLKEITSVEARRGTLTVKYAGGAASFELGKDAEKWALKIRYPRSRIEKLGVKQGMRASVLGVADLDFRRELRARTADVADGKPARDSDVIFHAAEERAALKRLAALKGAIKSAGAIWVVYPKGRKHITQADVMAAAKAAGLVDVKVVSFSDTHTALKLVIPLARR